MILLAIDGKNPLWKLKKNPYFLIIIDKVKSTIACFAQNPPTDVPKINIFINTKPFNIVNQ